MGESTSFKPPLNILYHECVGVSMASLMSDISNDNDSVGFSVGSYRSRKKNSTIHEGEDENEESSWKGYIDEKGNNRNASQDPSKQLTQKLHEANYKFPSTRLLKVVEGKTESSTEGGDETLITVGTTDNSADKQSSNQSNQLEEELLRLKQELESTKSEVLQQKMCLNEVAKERDNLRENNKKLLKKSLNRSKVPPLQLMPSDDSDNSSLQLMPSEDSNGTSLQPSPSNESASSMKQFGGNDEGIDYNGQKGNKDNEKLKKKTKNAQPKTIKIVEHKDKDLPLLRKSGKILPRDAKALGHNLNQKQMKSSKDMKELRESKSNPLLVSLIEQTQSWIKNTALLEEIDVLEDISLSEN